MAFSLTLNNMKYTEKVANIHESLNGRWHITDNRLPYLSERGEGFSSERDAIKAARSGTWTHRVNRKGKVVKL